MKDLFLGYYQPSKEEFETLWDECIFVFDTNILLNVYRYSDPTRNRFFEILDRIQDRVWIPYQVAHEYQEGRLDVILEQLKPYKEIQDTLKNNLDKLKSTIDNYRQRHSFSSLVNENSIIKIYNDANEKISKILAETREQFPDLYTTDIYRDRLTNLFSGKVGQIYSKDQYEECCKKIKVRFEQNTPPGYKDRSKSLYRKQYGDAIIWLQIIDYAKTQSKSVIFITDDTKEDWWKRHKGKTISPRPELIQEIKSKADVSFWMYTGDRFLEYAEKYIGLSPEPEVLEEAKDIRANQFLKLAELIEENPEIKSINNNSNSWIFAERRHEFINRWQVFEMQLSNILKYNSNLENSQELSTSSITNLLLANHIIDCNVSSIIHRLINFASILSNQNMIELARISILDIDKKTKELDEAIEIIGSLFV